MAKITSCCVAWKGTTKEPIAHNDLFYPFVMGALFAEENAQNYLICFLFSKIYFHTNNKFQTPTVYAYIPDLEVGWYIRGLIEKFVLWKKRFSVSMFFTRFVRWRIRKSLKKVRRSRIRIMKLINTYSGEVIKIYRR